MDKEELRGIGWAVKQMQRGACVKRAGWNGPDQWIAIQHPDQHSFMQEPYAYIKNQQGKRIPWLCSQGDLLATDWEIVSIFPYKPTTEA